MNIVTLCTGNVARSVMLGFMLRTLSDASNDSWEIRTAGTHVVEGSAMSARTREALLKIDALGDHRYGAHRSHQLDAGDVAWADVILAADADNVNYVRANFAADAAKAIQLKRFVRFAPLDGDVATQLRSANSLAPSTEFNVEDPARGDQADYDECARQLWECAQAFAHIVEEGERR